MTYNLLDERWIPVRRKSGAPDWIAPWQIAETDDPPVALTAPRADFDGALVQFLIGLLQTAYAPVDESTWRKRLIPPEPDTLRKAFDVHRDAFHLDGDGPRFMQDLTLKASEAEDVLVGALLIDSATGKTIEQNADVFNKRWDRPAFGTPAAAMTLLTLMLNAPAGGRGHRTSLRGGGPLTTVLLGETLWLTGWLNVLPTVAFDSSAGNGSLEKPENIFPWLAKTRTSERGEETGPERMHPLQHFWATPRRIRLQWDLKNGICMMTGLEGPVIMAASVKSYGANYKGAFLHSLTPYIATKPGEPPGSKKLSTDGLPYRDWPMYSLGSDKATPAQVIRWMSEGDRWRALSDKGLAPPRLLAFGYSMDNAKAEAWFSGLAPLVPIPADRARFVDVVSRAVRGADEIRRTAQSQVRKAIARRAEDVDSSSTTPVQVGRSFWSMTERDFFVLVDDLHRLVTEMAGEEAVNARLEEWAGVLQDAAKSLFSEHSQERGEFAATDIARVSRAWNELLRFTSLRNPNLRKAFGLMIEVPEKKPPTRGKRQS